MQWEQFLYSSMYPLGLESTSKSVSGNDSDPNLDTDIRLKTGTLTIRDLDQNLSPSLCNENMFCIVQCSHCVWNLNSSC